MSKSRGLHTYTVQEAQNATMGQAGSVFVKAASGNMDLSSNADGIVVVAIQIVEDAVFSLLTAQDSDRCVGSATSTIYFVLSSHPNLVLTVTGIFTCLTISAVIFCILSRSNKIPAPAPLQATFLTGHP